MSEDSEIARGRAEKIGRNCAGGRAPVQTTPRTRPNPLSDPYLPQVLYHRMYSRVSQNTHAASTGPSSSSHAADRLHSHAATGKRSRPAVARTHRKTFRVMI